MMSRYQGRVRCCPVSLVLLRGLTARGRFVAILGVCVGRSRVVRGGWLQCFGGRPSVAHEDRRTCRVSCAALGKASGGAGLQGRLCELRSWRSCIVRGCAPGKMGGDEAQISLRVVSC